MSYTVKAIEDTAEAQDRRQTSRVTAGFYAVEARGPARCFRLVRNVSKDGLLFENRAADERPGETIEIELQPANGGAPVRVKAEVVHVTSAGVGVRLLEKVDGLELAYRWGGRLFL